jgi:hypothetical protein
MPARVHTRLTAWLGLIAMCLVVLAPLVSQWVVAEHRDDADAALCSAVHGSSNAERSTHDDPLAACDYCGLLASHVAISAPPPSPPLLITLVVMAVVPVLSTRFTPLGAFPSGRPRAPPLFS